MRFFNEAYTADPPWEIGRPQPEMARRCDAGEIVGRVLDIGCGTGENAAYFAARGHPTVGIDFAPNAIRRAERKFGERDLPLRFEVADALSLEELGETFDTATDCGVYHQFSDDLRATYSESVRAALRPGGRFFVFCFRDDEPKEWGGPRRIAEAELRSSFSEGWACVGVDPARFETILPGVEGRAWLARFDREEPRRSGSDRGVARERRRTSHS